MADRSYVYKTVCTDYLYGNDRRIFSVLLLSDALYMGRSLKFKENRYGDKGFACRDLYGAWWS